MARPAKSARRAATGEAPLLGHLLELRRRLLICGAALLAASGAAFFFAREIFALLLIPYLRASAPSTDAVLQLIYTAPHEYFFTQIKLALFAGAALAFPVMAFQFYRFVAPGLYRKERHAFLPFLLASPLLFAAGAALVFFVVMPLALQFFLAMEHSASSGSAVEVQMLARVSEYLNFTMILMLAFGLCFQLPVVVVLLARLGLVGPAGLRRWRSYVIVGVFFVAAFLTPPDVVSQLGLALPTLLLYELSIWLAALVQKPQRAKSAKPQAAKPPPRRRRADRMPHA